MPFGLCSNCGREANYKCSVEGCSNLMCDVHSFPVMRAATKQSSALCLVHMDHQQERPEGSAPTIFVSHPGKLDEVLEIEYTVENATQYMVRGYTQVRAPETE